MSDKLVFDLAQEVEGSPNVFIRKDWLNILDNQNQNYNNNQSILDTSQLSNSNKYMSYREAYFLVPLTMTLQQTAGQDFNTASGFVPASIPADYSIGLKNWFGQIIHSFTLDYNGTTIIQQTPYVNMWNSFKLMTSLSYADVMTQGPTIGFYPDDSTTFTWTPGLATTAALGTRATSGQGIANNSNIISSIGPCNITSQYNQFRSGCGNMGFVQRTSYINYDSASTTDGSVLAYNATTAPMAYSDLLTSTQCTALWKSHIFNKTNSAVGTRGTLQIAVTATIYLKHIHSFFNMCPLLKGVFMKMTMNLNNSTTEFITGYSAGSLPFMACTSVSVPIGGVNPAMIASCGTDTIQDLVLNSTGTATAAYAPITISGTGAGAILTAGDTAFGIAAATPDSVSPTGAIGILDTNQKLTLNSLSTTIGYKSGGSSLLPTAVADAYRTYRYNISVGATCLDSQITNAGVAPMAKSVYLYIPAYTFNPVFEQAYLSSPVKQIKYTDIYQYQVLNVPASIGQFNNLLTNGIANIKSVLILPYYSTGSGTATTTTYATNVTVSNAGGTGSGFINGVPVFQSPFDPAGTGPTSPLTMITNFNVQISGQNAIYNLEKYGFEQFNNQLYGQNAVNGGLTDGITSGLISRQDFDMSYCYYYVNVERMLPVEQSVPKSVQIIGQNLSGRAIDLYCFIEYGVEVSIDALTGARV